MYKALINFHAGGRTIRAGDDIPKNTTNLDELLTNGLIKEVKTVKPKVTKAAGNDEPEPKTKTKRNK